MNTDGRVRHEADVVVVGGGPSGLAAAVALRKAGVERVEVLERESVAGGVPRHCDHPGYGMRDLHRVLTGPGYARHYADLAADAGAVVHTGATVTGWSPDGGLEVTSSKGLRTVHASAILLATGARERPRAARWVPGDRGQGVYTTGQLQQAVYFHNQPVGRRALIVGAEHVSFSAITTLRHAGVEVAGLVTELSRHQSYEAFRWGARLAFTVPVLTGVRVVEVYGKPAVTGVTLERVADGHRWNVPCDTVVFSGDWIPDHELARLRGVRIDSATRGPEIDATGLTSVDGVYAAGNLCHPVETADVAALTGRHVGHAVAARLRSRSDLVTGAGVPIEVDDSLCWVSPQRIRSTADLPARGKLILRPRIFARIPAVRVVQGVRVLWKGRLTRFIPTRPTLLTTSWLPRVDPNGPPVRIEHLP
ncbi:NAD(P)/FAD-dependent oxidoreductase [Rhizohabitans arisaemae]|uniref:NAD(P)/FAD-dependent oxidoreductase n=1 Tax=Rhizohabitans arisaemae TaxID=2720610 RepID=UPI0024B271B4|nr:FAD-dependent oxidoreductase [Rhizohabitans arisaemae]